MPSNPHIMASGVFTLANLSLCLSILSQLAIRLQGICACSGLRVKNAGKKSKITLDIAERVPYHRYMETNQMTTAFDILLLLAIYGALYILLPLGLLYATIRVVKFALR